ncbi:MAG: photosystem II manganese-stabilizing polypeptide [Prochlorothrix sp.]
MRYRAVLAAFLAMCLTFLTACGGSNLSASDRLTYDQLNSLSYDDIVGTGLASKCPQVLGDASESIVLEGGSFTLGSLCIEPSEYFVKEEPKTKRGEAQFEPAQPLTRLTATLDQVFGPLGFNDEGKITFTESGGIDFSAITVRLASGEQFPFLFTTKGLVATAADAGNVLAPNVTLGGDYTVPSYRTSNFLDPKARGLTAGYETAVALPSSGDAEEIERENIKSFDVGQGHIEFTVSKVDAFTGEVAGIFEAVQPSDTDMGSKEASDIKIRGLFYGRVDS